MIYHDLIMISSILYMDLNLNCWELPKKDGDLTGNAGNQINQTVKHGDFSPMMVHDVKGYKRIKQRLQRGTANPGNRLWSLMICKCCASATAARCHEKMSAAVVFSQRILTNSRVTHFCVDGKDGPRHGRNSRIPWAHEPLNWQYCGVWWMDGIPPLVICIRTNHSSPTNQWSQRSPFFQSSEPSVISSVAQFVQPPQKKSSPNLQISSTGPCHHVASSYHCFGHREGDVVSWVEELVLDRYHTGWLIGIRYPCEKAHLILPNIILTFISF